MPVISGRTNTAGAAFWLTPGTQKPSSAPAFRVAFSIWAAMNGSMGRMEPSAIPSEIIDPKRSETRSECCTICGRIASGSAANAEDRSSGPWSESWYSASAAAALVSRVHWSAGRAMARRWTRVITSKVRSKQATHRSSLASLWW